MGFATGFTGGVTLTLSVAYFTVVAHQRNRRQQCDALRANTNVLRALTLSNPAAAAQLAEKTGATGAWADPTMLGDLVPASQYYFYQNAPVPPRPRSNLVDELKGRWNAEILGAVRRVQITDWVAVRETAEDTVARLWTRAFGTGTPAGNATTALKERVVSAAENTKAEAQAVAKTLKDTTNQAVQKGKDALGTELAKTADGSDAKTTDVKKAMEQRYSKKPSDAAAAKKSVNELLEERYEQSV